MARRREGGREDASEDELYKAMDWLLERQDRIERRLGRRLVVWLVAHLGFPRLSWPQVTRPRSHCQAAEGTRSTPGRILARTPGTPLN